MQRLGSLAESATLPLQSPQMDTARIADLLQPFLLAPLSTDQLTSISTYIELLLRWNARINLTAVREEKYIVKRHFGESLFAARHLFPAGQASAAEHLIDVGSGAGFPGLPIKIWNPDLRLTLIDSNQKKATFLREAIRTLELANVEVFAGRTEDYPSRAEIVTLRAVEKFDQSLPAAAHLLNSHRGARGADSHSDGRPGSLPRAEPKVPALSLPKVPALSLPKGPPSEARAPTGNPHSPSSVKPTTPLGSKLALLIGDAQRGRAQQLQASLLWDDPRPIPLSTNRILLIGTRPSEPDA
jgi:16S rRNA (guanine527-N7)-methyltransferase